MDLTSIEEAIAYAHRRWPGYTFKRKSDDEACGPCPIERQGDDRFIIWINGNYYCRRCGATGWLDEDDSTLSPSERRLLAIEAEQRRARREREQMQRQLTAIQRMMRSTDHITYHKLLDERDRAWWHAQGIHDKLIDEYMLGICYNCPTAPRHPSYTIPVFDSTWTKLLNIRHRLADATTGDRYRPHMAGLPGKLLFNARWTREHEELMVVEGEKKSIVVSDQVMPAVGILGASGFDMRWLRHFNKVKRLYVALDPDVQEKAETLAQEIAAKSKMEVRVVRLPCKPDDFLTLYGGSIKTFKRHLDQAWKVN